MTLMTDRYDISLDPKWNHCFNLLLDNSVSEIEVNGPGSYWCKKGGKRLRISELDLPHGVSQEDAKDEFVKSIEKGLVPHVASSEPFEENSYLFEGPLRFKDDEGNPVRGRCHVALPPACDYPQITIAKKSTSLRDLDGIAMQGSMSAEMLLFLTRAVEADLTIAISGGTGAGKTTMLEAITKLWSHQARIGVAEDTPELALIQPNVTYLHSVPWKPGMDPNKVATLSWVVQQYQRMRVDKIIIGETRGLEFADFLIAANSGMEGSLTTLHANDPSQCLDKMTNFALKAASNVPIRTVNNDIANAVDIIVQLGYLSSGKHRMMSITEVTNTLSTTEDARITTNMLYKYSVEDDAFIKEGQPTDHLRKKLELKNIDLTPFRQVPVQSKSGGYAGEFSRQQVSAPAIPTVQEPSRGLPVSFGERRI